MSEKLSPLRFEMASHSMWPVLRKGDFILVRPLIRKEPALGTVVAFAADHRLVCHRLIGIETKGDRVWYRTRGDGHFTCDPVKSLEDLWGEVVAVEGAPFRSLFLSRFSGVILFWLRTRDWVVLRCGGTPAGWRFSLLYMGLTPWLVFRPRGGVRR